MRFSDVAGQERAKAIVKQQLATGTLPHAIMLTGREGVGKLPLALMLARLLVCESPREGEPCEECPSCLMSAKWVHPDLHFSFPVIKAKASDQPTSDDYVAEWREQISEQPYFTQGQWLERMGAVNQQMQHFVGESESLNRKLSLRPTRGGRRAVVVWLPERMMEACANKLLKLVEEPPLGTYFIMVSQSPEQVLPTIVSRTQRLHLPPLTEEELARALAERRSLSPDEAMALAHLSQGSLTRALSHTGGEESEELDRYTSLMRTAYSRRIKEMRAWGEDMAGLGRERQKASLDYFQRMTRENYIHNMGERQTLCYMTPEEEAFSERFSPFVNERNVEEMTRQLALAQRDIEQNVNARMVFLDLMIKMTILLRR